MSKLLPSSFPYSLLSSFLGGPCTATHLLFACLSLPSQFCCSFSYILGLPPQENALCSLFTPSSLILFLFTFLSASSCLLGAKNCPCPRSAGWWAKWFIPRRGGLHPPQEGSKGFEGAVFRCFSKTISFFQFPSEQTKFTKSWATFFSHLSFPGILLGVKYKCILLLEVIFVWQKHFTLIKIKMSIQFLKFKMLVLT